MIYLVDRRFTIEGALDILINQIKCPDGYEKCQCLGCKTKAKVEVNDNVDGNLGTCFTDDNDNGNVNDNVNDNGNQENCLADDNDDDDKYISIFSERTPSVARQTDEFLGSPTKQRDKR